MAEESKSGEHRSERAAPDSGSQFMWGYGIPNLIELEENPELWNMNILELAERKRNRQRDDPVPPESLASPSSYYYDSSADSAIPEACSMSQMMQELRSELAAAASLSNQVVHFPKNNTVNHNGAMDIEAYVE